MVYNGGGTGEAGTFDTKDEYLLFKLRAESSAIYTLALASVEADESYSGGVQ